MLVYTGTKKEFINDVLYNLIADKIKENLVQNGLAGGGDSEYASWNNSMNFMKNILEPDDIPNANIAIEYEIPRTSKRVDFMISGRDDLGRENIVVIELKQWSEAEKIDDVMRHSVRTYTGHSERTVNHPSYQAYSYAVHIRNACATIQDKDISVVPCSYLHNYKRKNIESLEDKIYQMWIDEAPFFIADQVKDFHDFVKKYISKESGDNELLFEVDHGRIRPSKALQDSIVSVMKGNPEFLLLDDQATAYDYCLQAMELCIKDRCKRTLVIQGGPGTGKSVLAINLLKEMTLKNLNASYCTKNSAPRNAFTRLLSKSDLKKEIDVKSLFRSPFRLCQCPPNFFDCLIVDEAHRLVRQMYGDFHGENQIKECINASLLSIFLIDENQAVTTKDIGSISEIEKWCKTLDSKFICNQDLVLTSQFRCNGSDLYIQFVNNLLQIGPHVDLLGAGENEKYSIKVFDKANDMKEALRKLNTNNKARMIAGYCYDWNVKNGRSDVDISLDSGEFEAKWNLFGDDYWAVNPNTFDQVGCIHTAQGLEFDYVGVIIGRDLRFDPLTGKVITDRTKISKDDKTSGIRAAKDDVAEKLIKNTYKTLLTRGQKGCFIYCEDKNLREWIKKEIAVFNKQL